MHNTKIGIKVDNFICTSIYWKNEEVSRRKTQTKDHPVILRCLTRTEVLVCQNKVNECTWTYGKDGAMSVKTSQYFRVIFFICVSGGPFSFLVKVISTFIPIFVVLPKKQINITSIVKLFKDTKWKKFVVGSMVNLCVTMS